MKKMIFSAVFAVALCASAVWAQDQAQAPAQAQDQAQAPAQAQDQAQAPTQAQDQAQAPAQAQDQAQAPAQAQATPGPAQPVAAEAKPEAKPVEVKLDRKAREQLKREKAAQRQAAKAAQRQAEKAKAQKKNPKEKKEPKELGKGKEKPFRPDFRSDFSQRMLKGNIEDAFRKYPEFREIVRKELNLEAQSRELVKKIRAEKDAKKKAELENQLREVVGKLFDARQARRMFELKIFEDRIQELRKQTEDRNTRKDRIVEKHMMEIIGTDEDLRF